MRKNCFIFLLTVVIIMSMGSASYAYREIERGSFYEARQESVIVIESKESLLTEFLRLNMPKFEMADDFDFAKELLVLIIASAQPNPGYSIAAETVEVTDGETNVKYKTIPGPEGLMYAQVISYPWLLVAVER